MATTVFPPQFGNLPNAAEFFARGLQMRQQVEMQREQLAAQREAASLAAEVRMKEAAAQAARDQQRLMVEDAYQRANIGLREQQLAQAQQKLDLDTQLAAQRYALETSYMTEGRRRLAAGEAPEKVWATLNMQYGPLLTGSMSGLAALTENLKAPTDWKPRALEVGEAPGPKAQLVETSPGKYQQIINRDEGPGEGWLSMTARENLKELRAEETRLRDKYETMSAEKMYPPAEYSSATNRIAEIQREKKRMLGGGTQKAAPPGAKRREDFPANQRFVRDRQGRVWAYMGQEKDPTKETNTDLFILVSE